KRPQYFTPERQRGVTIKFDRAERAAFANLLTVMPRPEHEKHLVVVCVFRLDGFVDGDVAVDVFLVPKTVNEHHRHFQRLRRENLVDRLIAPVSVVTRVFEQLAPEADLFETTAPAELTRRTRFHKHVVVVGVARPTENIVCARSLLIVDVPHALLAKRAPVKPVV